MSSEDFSLAEFIAQGQRGLMGKTFGDDWMSKGYLTIAETTFAQTYGRKAWDALNNKRVTFNALKKVPWGQTAGWVLRTDRGSGRVQPVTETGALPTIDTSNYEGVYSLPKIPAATFGVPIKSVFVNTLEGGMGDILATEQEACERDFLKDINRQLISRQAARCTGGTTTTAIIPASQINCFRVGDQLKLSDAGTERTGGTISSIDYSTNTITVDTAWGNSTTCAAGDIIFVGPAACRAASTSLFDITTEDDENVSGYAVGASAYNLVGAIGGGSRVANTYGAGAYVDGNSGVLRDLTLTMMDTQIQKIRENGGEPKLIVMGWDQYFRLERLLAAQQRYMGQEEYVAGHGDERTLKGTRTGLVLSTYMGIPIMPDPDMPVCINSSGTAGGSDIMFLDTDFIELAVALPTQYVENRDYFAVNKLVVRGLMYMMMELRCLRLDVHSRITDLNA